MKLGALFSGGKDSAYAVFLSKNFGYEISCLISLVSKNNDSYMFHTPSISKVKNQAREMKIPLVEFPTAGKKELELDDLKAAIKSAIEKYKIEGVVTGAVESVYQASRIQKICWELGIECFNPLWQKNQIELLKELVENKFGIIVTGVAAYPFDRTWLGKVIDKKFIEEIKELNKKYKINPAGEGGEFETFVLSCPLFNEGLILKDFEVSGSGNSWRMEIKL